MGVNGYRTDIGVFIDPITHHFAEDRLFAQHPYSDFHRPWVRVQERFAERSIKVQTADRLVNGDSVFDTNVYFAVGTLRNYKTLAERSDTILSALFHTEAPIIHPSTYRGTAEAAGYFRRIYSFSTAEALAPFGCGGLSLRKFQIPEPYDGIEEPFVELWNRRDRRFLCMITQNKLPNLDYNELYTERLRLLEHFSRTGSIDLYGIGWDKMPFRVGERRLPQKVVRVQRFVWERIPFTRNHPYERVIKRVWRGAVDSKHEVMSRYTFAICYENMTLEGWLNEKIFDAFVVGTIPVYLGATDVTKYIPPECFIDPRPFASHGELEDYLRSLGPEEIRAYRENAREFMASDAYRPFTKDAFADIFVEAFDEDVAAA